ncbi:MAG: hypothetical protein AB9917_18200 [Negativicutes bacterium]
MIPASDYGPYPGANTKDKAMWSGPWLGLDHSLGKNWSIGAAIDYSSYTANRGTDQVNLADGSNVHLPLNKVNWDSWAYRLTATYRF